MDIGLDISNSHLKGMVEKAALEQAVSTKPTLPLDRYHIFFIRVPYVTQLSGWTVDFIDDNLF